MTPVLLQAGGLCKKKYKTGYSCISQARLLLLAGESEEKGQQKTHKKKTNTGLQEVRLFVFFFSDFLKLIFAAFGQVGTAKIEIKNVVFCISQARLFILHYLFHGICCFLQVNL